MRGMIQVERIACGHSHTHALGSTRHYSWGSNRAGELGTGQEILAAVEPQLVPAPWGSLRAHA
ncbi:hypothetical protein T484DRAFT_1823198 [Baffinella frigidus]|nr:hypothetical protein T484DRAFT_1823198 [Cryptophyta sp. CCMP2293]